METRLIRYLEARLRTSTPHVNLTSASHLTTPADNYTEPEEARYYWHIELIYDSIQSSS